jgi:hypothetical protein
VATIDQQNDKTFYESPSWNWYSALPYGFRITTQDGTTHVIFLPISPSNLSITTNFATNMVPTLYGTVEEHSNVRYFDIAIEGTTGIAPKYSNTFTGRNKLLEKDNSGLERQTSKKRNPGRETFSVGDFISLGGFFSKTIGALQQIKNQASAAINGNQAPNPPGVNDEQSGYTAFHNFYKMLLLYKRDVSGIEVKTGSSSLINKGLNAFGIKPVPVKNTERKIHPIVFFNYKDNNQYNVVINNFTMKRSAENPMLYYYSITMRGYELSGLSGGIQINDKERLKDLGLDGVDGSSLLSEMKNRANSARGAFNALSAGINILGR